MTPYMKTMQAGDLVGHEGEFRLVGGRTVYEAVLYNDATARSGRVRLGRIAVEADGIHQINRWVDWETPVEVLRDFTAEADAERECLFALDRRSR